MTACIIHDALRENNKDFRCQTKDEVKSRGKAISRFFSSRHRDSLRNSGQDLSALKLAVVLNAKRCRGKQTVPKHNARFNLLSVPVVT